MSFNPIPIKQEFCTVDKDKVHEEIHSQLDIQEEESHLPEKKVKIEANNDNTNEFTVYTEYADIAHVDIKSERQSLHDEVNVKNEDEFDTNDSELREESDSGPVVKEELVVGPVVLLKPALTYNNTGTSYDCSFLRLHIFDQWFNLNGTEPGKARQILQNLLELLPEDSSQMDIGNLRKKVESVCKQIVRYWKKVSRSRKCFIEKYSDWLNVLETVDLPKIMTSKSNQEGFSDNITSKPGRPKKDFDNCSKRRKRRKLAEASQFNSSDSVNESSSEEIQCSEDESHESLLRAIGLNKHFDETYDEWMRLVDDLSDCDMDVDLDDEEVNHLPNVSARDPLPEPATEDDITDFEAQVLVAEDRRNDEALRDIVPTDDFNFEWDTDSHIFKGQREKFIASSGPTFPITDQTRAVDIFYEMFDSGLLDLLCLETIRYAKQKITYLKSVNKLLPNSRLHRWTPINKDEMISFLALTILQGLYPLPDEESYFSFNGFGSMPYFSRIMSYNRYFLIKSLLQFVDNENITEPTMLSRIQPVIDYFNEKFSSLYYPSQEIVIDEFLLKWHGRLSFAQKIQSKAANVGVKTYELCESSSGYLWKFFVYAGKTKPRNTSPLKDNMTGHVKHSNDMTGPEISTDSTDQPTNATVKIVYELLRPLLHNGHTLIMDNFYNSPLLARFLKRQKTDCYGTLRLNREFVPDSLKALNKSELRRGEVAASYCSDLSVIAWRDANIVSLISTYHSSITVPTKNKYNVVTYKPSILLDYNKSMGGVDRKDQYLSAHLTNQHKVWYKKLFRRIFNAAIFNCFVIFATSNPRINQRQFRTVLAEDLLKLHRRIDLTEEKRLITRRFGVTTTTSAVRPKGHQRPQLEHRHFPTRTGFKQSRCWMCAQRKVLTRTVWKCLECDVNLCIEHCFMNYHIKP